MPNLCECGCGNPVPIVMKTNLAQGRVKGQPSRFVIGHARRRPRASLYTVEDQSGCWRWNGALTHHGYPAGTLSNAGRQGVAHRVFYEEAKGLIPAGLVIDHLCRVRDCVNPAHLEAVTPKENRRRATDTVLTVEDVHEIRTLKQAGLSQAAIARRFNVGAPHISKILSGDSWRD